MIKRFLLLAAVVAYPVLAAPMTIVFSGNATGSVGATAFTNQAFSITFTTDNSSVTHGTACCADDYTTPSGTSAAADFGAAGKFTLADNQAVFVHQSEQTLGIWHYNSPDYLTVGNPAFSTYTLSASFAATQGTTNVFPTAAPMKTSAGDLTLQSVSGVSVQVTVGTGGGTPVIEAAAAAYGTGVSQNTWIAITGTNLAPAGTPVGGALWSNAASFANGLMPDSLNGVSVKVNGKTAYVYFYCAASTAPGAVCTSKDQINALTPLDATTGPVDVVVSNGSTTSAAFKVTETQVTPSLFKWDGSKPYVTATHADYSILGPASLFTGLSTTPASVGETVVLWASGFGLPKDTLTAGSATQSSPLAVMPTCQINNASAKVDFAGVVSPGLYQLNVEIPNGATDGDNPIQCTYQGVNTQDGLQITVKR